MGLVLFSIMGHNDYFFRLQTQIKINWLNLKGDTNFCHHTQIINDFQKMVIWLKNISLIIFPNIRPTTCAMCVRGPLLVATCWQGKRESIMKKCWHDKAIEWKFMNREGTAFAVKSIIMLSDLVIYLTYVPVRPWDFQPWFLFRNSGTWDFTLASSRILAKSAARWRNMFKSKFSYSL